MSSLFFSPGWKSLDDAPRHELYGTVTFKNIPWQFKTGMLTVRKDGNVRADNEDYCNDVEHIITLKQIHSADCIEVKNMPSGRGQQVLGTGDALFISNPLLARSVAIAVRTADCAPIVITGAVNSAVIHAGWRGLAAGIIEETIAHFEPDEINAVFIFPAARSCCYEVGEEVVTAIGVASVTERREKLYLDVVETAANIIRKQCPKALLWTAEQCTICDERFYSFRREGLIGHNHTYLTIVPE